MIRQRARFETLPVIALTANAMASDVAKALACGMNDHIVKPVEMDVLFEKLLAWIRPSTDAA
ncbi:MAG: response regulator [Burkholderiales bacterium]|nr:MAG: response regulator [Burkholderiales bacterium]